MGIQSLLPALKSVVDADLHISAFRGRRVAVDGYAWLHKAIYGCCVELCEGKPSTAWIQYCLAYVDMLVAHEIDVTLVFDGAELPAKLGTETERAQKRANNLSKGREYTANGDHKTARNYYAQAVDVTPRMAAELIQVLRARYPLVKVIVAPYEADAQLAYLSLHRIVDVIISEDSDNIPFGCQEVIFKLERDGSCQRLLLANIFTNAIERFDCRGFTQEMIVIMCILSGCDYLDSPVKGFGIKSAHKLVTQHRTASNVLKQMRINGQLPLIPYNHTAYPGARIDGLLEYELRFYQALATFHHQVVFDPRTRQTVHLNELTLTQLPSCLVELCASQSALSTEFLFLGQRVEPALACGIADGLVCPVSKQPFNLPPLPAPVSNKPPLQRSATYANSRNSFPPPASTGKRISSFFASTTAARPSSDSKLHLQRPPVEDVDDIYMIDALCNEPSGGVSSSISGNCGVRAPSPSVELSSLNAVTINSQPVPAAKSPFNLSNKDVYDSSVVFAKYKVTPKAPAPKSSGNGGQGSNKKKKVIPPSTAKDSLMRLKNWQLQKTIELSDSDDEPAPVPAPAPAPAPAAMPETANDIYGSLTQSPPQPPVNIFARFVNPDALAPVAIDLTDSPRKSSQSRTPPSQTKPPPADAAPTGASPQDNPFWKYTCSP